MRYEHQPYQLPDGRWMITRRAAAKLGHRHVDHIRKLCEAQRHRWAAGHRGADEQPIEVLCTVKPRMVLLHLDAVEDVLRGREHRDRDRLQPLSG